MVSEGKGHVIEVLNLDAAELDKDVSATNTGLVSGAAGSDIR